MSVDSGVDDDAFTTEYFAPVLAVTELGGEDAGAFLEEAVRFANDRLFGTLTANLIGDPATRSWTASRSTTRVATLLALGTGENRQGVRRLGFPVARGVGEAAPLERTPAASLKQRPVVIITTGRSRNSYLRRDRDHVEQLGGLHAGEAVHPLV